MQEIQIRTNYLRKTCYRRMLRYNKKGKFNIPFGRYKNYNYDILLGTQMVSKGLDFHGVTLVGVINGDTSLYIPDFRSGERTFQLLYQVFDTLFEFSN